MITHQTTAPAVDLGWVDAVALAGRLEVSSNGLHGVGRLPDADDHDPADSPIGKDVVVPESGGPFVDRPNVRPVRLDDLIDASASDLGAEDSSDHVCTSSPRYANAR